MEYKANTIEEYFSNIAIEHKDKFIELYKIIHENLDTSFETGILYKMPSFFVPHSVYPSGYHCDPKMPLPFISIAVQKNFIAFYHMGLYADNALTDWFVDAYKSVCNESPDMGKSCVRFKFKKSIPLDLIAELCRKLDVNDWINLYEKLKPVSKK